MDSSALWFFTPALRLALLGFALALGPLIWMVLRHRRTAPEVRLRHLTLLTLFLTFDLVIFGAFTRLTDSGLGCPDWPGCYGSASPLGAKADIHAAQSAMPTGPVTHVKAWIEMIHRYFASGVGMLIIVLLIMSWWEARQRRNTLSLWWPIATLVWVCLQGAFGAFTVTMKLYPAIVTAHLLGGMGLLALLAVQSQGALRATLSLPRYLYLGAWGVLALSVLQIALGGWVSSNYAVLACSDFPACQGSWWPVMDFDEGFTLFRELGVGSDGNFLPFPALTAIHFAHRLGAAVVLTAMWSLAWLMYSRGGSGVRPWAFSLGGIALWQFVSGLSNVVLGWPMVAALAHTGGAAALIVLLCTLLARAAPVLATPVKSPRSPVHV